VVVLERQIRTLEREVKELKGKDGRIADSARKIDEETQRLKKRRVSLVAKDVRGLRNSLRNTVNYFSGDNPSSIKRQIRDFEDF
jgi:predicted  nucleic acid-binding Zn-ribbon protein